MLSYFAKRSRGGGFDRTAQAHEYTSWVHGDEVTQEDLDTLVARYDLVANIVRDVRDVSELPRIEYGPEGELYLFVRVPRLTTRGEVYRSPLLAVVTRERFFTLGYSDLFSPDEISDDPRVGHDASPLQLALLSMAAIIDDYERLIHRTSRAVRDVGHRLRTHEVTNRDFIRFVTIEDNLNEYTTNLSGMAALAQHLKDNRHAPLAHADIEMVDDMMLHIQQLLVAVGSQSQSIISIRNASSTIANNVLNQRMKTLTVLTVLIALPNVFYGMYGMNVALPFAEQPWAYGAVVAFTVVIIIAVYLVARRFRIF